MILSMTVSGPGLEATEASSNHDAPTTMLHHWDGVFMLVSSVVFAPYSEHSHFSVYSRSPMSAVDPWGVLQVTSGAQASSLESSSFLRGSSKFILPVQRFLNGRLKNQDVSSFSDVSKPSAVPCGFFFTLLKILLCVESLEESWLHVHF